MILADLYGNTGDLQFVLAAVNDVKSEVNTQTDLIEQIMDALKGKTAGSGSGGNFRAILFYIDGSGVYPAEEDITWYDWVQKYDTNNEYYCGSEIDNVVTNDASMFYVCTSSDGIDAVHGSDIIQNGHTYFLSSSDSH